MIAWRINDMLIRRSLELFFKIWDKSMFFLQKKLAVLVLVAGAIFASGCATVGGADSAVLGDLLTERQVIRALYEQPDLTGEPIQVSCVDGYITLSGSVDSRVDYELAERIAAGVAGVTGVNNALQVDS